MTDLKKCPLCGNEAVLDKIGNGHYSVRCDACGSHTPMRFTLEEVEKYWNGGMNSELKPCPICDWPASIIKCNGKVQIRCKNHNCGLSTLFWNNKEAAERIWNMRTEENNGN